MVLDKFFKDEKIKYILNLLLKYFVFILISFLFLYKLDYHYFFTDEILYTHSGQSYVKGIYEDNLQHPLLGKYLVGFISVLSIDNVSILRFPYALFGILSTYIVYLIVKEFYNEKYALLGSLLYVFSPFIYDSTRMVMFESPMHFFWLLFHLFFIKYIKIFKLSANDSKFVANKYLWYSGIFLGLSIATKIPSLLLYVFSFIVYLLTLYTKYKSNSKESIVKLLFKSNNIKPILYLYIISFFVYFLTYLHLIYTSGFDTLLEVAKETLLTFIGRNVEGKNHIINGNLYTTSPWWSYLYFLKTSYSFPQIIILILSISVLFFRRNFYTLYWFLFLFLNIIFFQVIPLKNSRYLASIEISVVFLSISVFYYLIAEYSNRFVKYLSIFLLSLVFIIRVIYVMNIGFTEYNWVFNYFKYETNNFSIYKRMYVLGSIRTLKWYRNYIPDEDMFLYRRDYNITCPEFISFDYIAFEKEELLMDPDNLLFKFASINIDKFERIDIPNFVIFKKVSVEQSSVTNSFTNVCNLVSASN